MPVHLIYCNEWFCPKFKIISNAFEIWFRNGFEKKKERKNSTSPPLSAQLPALHCFPLFRSGLAYSPARPSSRFGLAVCSKPSEAAAVFLPSLAATPAPSVSGVFFLAS